MREVAVTDGDKVAAQGSEFSSPSYLGSWRSGAGGELHGDGAMLTR
ncbi:hypothetical protein ACNKHU_00375 [Shigella flexneri]